MIFIIPSCQQAESTLCEQDLEVHNFFYDPDTPGILVEENGKRIGVFPETGNVIDLFNPGSLEHRIE